MPYQHQADIVDDCHRVKVSGQVSVSPAARLAA
jgi:hypothetical protein